MEQSSPPSSLPQYLAEGLPKQDTETLHEIQNYAVLNARRRQHRIFDIRSSAGSGALVVDSKIGRFGSSRIARQPKHQSHKIPREV